MSFLRGTGGDGSGGLEPIARAAGAHEEERRSARSGLVGVGTLACSRCDAPVAIGPSRLVPTETVSCPFCNHRAPARDFLSLEVPARPTRVVVRVSGIAGLY